MDEDIKGQLVTLYGNNILNIGHDRLLVLNMACADGFVTNESLRYILNIHKTDITELLKEMCESGLLVAEGYGRGTKYKLISSSANVATSIVGETFSKKRLKPADLEHLISETCEDWISLEDLSTTIGRNSTYLRNRIIPRLLEGKILEMMFPGVPNHPSQKYKRKEK